MCPGGSSWAPGLRYHLLAGSTDHRHEPRHMSAASYRTVLAYGMSLETYGGILAYIAVKTDAIGIMTPVLALEN